MNKVQSIKTVVCGNEACLLWKALLCRFNDCCVFYMAVLFLFFLRNKEVKCLQQTCAGFFHRSLGQTETSILPESVKAVANGCITPWLLNTQSWYSVMMPSISLSAGTCRALYKAGVSHFCILNLSLCILHFVKIDKHIHFTIRFHSLTLVIVTYNN